MTDGLLKEKDEKSDLQEALSKKRKKLAETRIGLEDKEKEEDAGQ